ncbi:MAG TPA: SRPBCC family protein [Verrucomicrobiae bacterium]|nr:SRPBCC family protein [Verrucomicrobiae bacterium]
MDGSDAGHKAARKMARRTIFTADPETPTIVMTRIFDAPRALVFEVYTNPKHIPQWWGPKILETTVEKMDVRPGGEWRIVQRAPDGQEFRFHGEYREVTPPEKVVSTFVFEGEPEGVVLNTTTFDELDGVTKLTTTSVFRTRKDLDGMMKSGMESGANESMERLAELLAGMQ